MAGIVQRSVSAEEHDTPVEAVQVDKPQIEEIPRGADFKQLFKETKFMEERVKIYLHPTMDESEVGVPVSVNGDRVYITPNKLTWVKRKHVAQLLKARPDVVNHRSDNPLAPERELNPMTKFSTSRYNFDYYDSSPKGNMWFRELRQHMFKK